ncbi:MAG: nitrite/sulfite reductase [Phycisphaerae bacterium]|nr:nitrite/sulfite reductase [Phycisphaerae bacterium]
MAVKAAQAEELKRIKDGLDVWDDIHRYAAAGDYAAIDPDDLDRFKWYGIYKQKPNEGHFMLRIKMPGGALTAFRLREIGQLARRYGRNFGDVTTRQDIQLHWLRVQDLPDALSTIYQTLGMHQEFACGDTPRNVTACPLAGELADEIVDTRPFAQAITDMYRAGGREFSNLPRKFKTSISGCRVHCHAPQINCLAFFGVERKRANGRERGFGVSVGGGLRDTPHFGQSLRVFLKPDLGLVIDVCRATAHIFRDQSHLREGRLRARLKFYVAQIGWEAFRVQLEHYLGYPLEHDQEIVAPAGASSDDHAGGGVLKNGLAFVGVPVPCGRLTGDQMMQLADLAERYCRDPERQINASIKQNLLLLNIPRADLPDVKKGLADIGLPSDAPLVRQRILSCTGTQFCNLAVVETKDRARRILDYLEANVPMQEPIFISVTGCPNSCAQYQIAEIGLQGTLYNYKGRKGVEHYHILLGGRLGSQPEFGRFVCRDGDRKIKVPAELVHLAIAQVIRAYQAEKRPSERFPDWALRQEMDRLAELVTVSAD